ncbi:MAG: nucleotidyl transferase AbiEii/AbiGii toxin family protein [Kiritimatiellia bacterium]
MIAKQCLSAEWVRQEQARMPQASAETIEKAIRALALLERLAASGLRFIFKGGTCMMLHLQELRRLSVDVDIVCMESRDKIETALGLVAAEEPFLSWEPDPRNPDRRPRRKHYKLHYRSLNPDNREPFVLLDVVIEHTPYPFTEKKPVQAQFIQSANPPLVTVPTINGLLGDKLTAFAPNTVGVRYKPALSQQIIKQMFDVGELFLVGTNIDQIAKTHTALFAAENGFRNGKYTLEGALNDTLETAFRISQLNLRNEEKWDNSKRGMLLAGITAINATLIQARYTVDDARVSASRVALTAALILAGRTGKLARFRHDPDNEAALPATLPGRFAVFNILRQTAPEVFYNWNQVQNLIPTPFF